MPDQPSSPPKTAHILTRRTQSRLRPLFVFGTRPEAIKLAPVIEECRRSPEDVDPIVCSSGQHREMLDQVLGYFQIEPDVELRLMKPGQTLSGLTARCIEGVDQVVQDHQPDCVVVQGDTTTVLAASMVAFYHQVPIVHVEAGLRTGDLQAPWPEEFNRRVAGLVTTLHCAPTKRAADALANEGVCKKSIRITGNTVIDALLKSVERERQESSRWRRCYPMVDAGPIVLITGHRRENFGRGLEEICLAISELAKRYPDVQFLYPVHLNPNVKGPVHRILGDATNIHLLPPADYPAFVWLMDQASIIITDSGGVQEEAPSLGCAVIVTRNKTERPEAVEAGLAELVGTNRDLLVTRVSALLDHHSIPPQGKTIENPYGDGKASGRIVDWMMS